MVPVSAATERDEVKTIVVRDGVVSGAPAAPIAERPRRIGKDRAVLTLKNGVERRPKVQARVFAHQGEHEFAFSELLESMAAIGVPANLRDLKKLKQIFQGYYARGPSDFGGRGRLSGFRVLAPRCQHRFYSINPTIRQSGYFPVSLPSADCRLSKGQCGPSYWPGPA